MGHRASGHFFSCAKKEEYGLCEIWNGFFFTNVFATFFCDKFKKKNLNNKSCSKDIIDTLLDHSFIPFHISIT